MFDLSDKVAIVTGGNGGIGLAIGLALSNAGARVVVAARNQTKTEEAVRLLKQHGPGAFGLTVDVSDEGSVASMVGSAIDEYGRIDILVNNAGTNIRRDPQDLTLQEWDTIVDTNLKGCFLCAREVYPHMVGVGGGKIINIGSMFSLFGSRVVAAYGASKGGVVQLTKSLAVGWARDNIQVNAILPGWIKTDLTAPIQTEDPERYKLISSRIPYERWGEPEDMGGAAVFLASSASDYVTGVALPVDGGYSSS
jgi:2-deoxy-D-gluconate 3-dehydrogenase